MNTSTHMAIHGSVLPFPRRWRSSVFVNGRAVYTTLAIQKAGRTMAKSVLEAEILLHLKNNHNIDVTA